MHVLIADDHALVRDALKRVLRSIDPDAIIRECGNMLEALELGTTYPDLDLAILDLIMPGMNGVSGIKEFHSRFPSIPILVLSGYYQRKDVVAAFEHGVAGFLSKGVAVGSMANAIRLVLSGERYVPPDMIVNATDDRNDDKQNPLRQLSERETDILAKLMDGLTNKEIGRQLDIEEVTVKLHLSSIYRKIGVNNRTQAVKFALDHGWQA